ncbi:hypothetical protein D3C73_1155710 [compost metagenome]
MFEPHQVHRRAFQFQLQGLAIERGVQATDAMFVGTEAAVFMVMVVIMFLRCLGDSQRQQGERQSEEQTTHG